MSRALLLAAHGSSDARAQASTEALAENIRGQLPSVEVVVSYLEHAEPSVHDAYAALTRDHAAITVVPLLFTPGYHNSTDLLAQLGDTGAQITAPLGAHPLVAAALRDSLVTEALAQTPVDEWEQRNGAVVLASAGSNEPAAIAEVHAVAGLLSESLGLPVHTATPDDLADVIGRVQRDGASLVAVVSLLLAPGAFADAIRTQAINAGADIVAGPIGEHPSIAVLVASRYVATTTEAAA